MSHFYLVNYFHNRTNWSICKAFCKILNMHKKVTSPQTGPPTHLYTPSRLPHHIIFQPLTA